MQRQTAQIAILAHALIGTLITVKRGDKETELIAGQDAMQHLQPGDEVTIKVASDDRWVERQKNAEAKAAEKANARDDVDHSAKPEPTAAGSDSAVEASGDAPQPRRGTRSQPQA